MEKSDEEPKRCTRPTVRRAGVNGSLFDICLLKHHHASASFWWLCGYFGCFLLATICEPSANAEVLGGVVISV